MPDTRIPAQKEDVMKMVLALQKLSPDVAVEETAMDSNWSVMHSTISVGCN